MIHDFLSMIMSLDVPWLAVFILFIGTEAATILIMHAAAKAAEAKAFDAGLRVGRSNKLMDAPQQTHELEEPPQARSMQRLVRLVCSEWRCRWCGPESEALCAPDPFNDGDTLIACPKCREQTLCTCCDEPGCTMEAYCGTPTPEGYRWTCGKHQPNAKLSDCD